MAGWSKKIIANLIDPEETRIAITDERGKLCDFFIERMLEHQRTGEIYKARVDSVLPGMNSAFLNLGDGRNGFSATGATASSISTTSRAKRCAPAWICWCRSSRTRVRARARAYRRAYRLRGVTWC